MNQLRLELSFKNLEELKRKIEFCLNNEINKINIPCKGVIKKEFLLDIVDYIGTNYNQLDVVYHYSLFHQFNRNKRISYTNFLNFIDKFKNYNSREILLISGSRKKKEFDVINLFELLKNDLNCKIDFGVAYNPYFYEKDQIHLERERFVKKLNSNLVSSVWFQFGSDYKALENEFEFINKQILKNKRISKKNIKIYGSLFIPSRQFLARFKFRPWRELFLSDKYLNSLEYSNRITRIIYDFYRKNNIKPLIESECSSINQLKVLNKLLE